MPYWVGAANTLRQGFNVYFFYWRNVRELDRNEGAVHGVVQAGWGSLGYV